MPEIAYVNGLFCDLADAKVSMEDRGFQFADGVYEVIAAPGGRPFKMAEHLARLKRSTDGIDLPIDFDALDLPAIIHEGIRRCGFDDVLVYLQITRGVAARDHLYPRVVSPTVVASFKRKAKPDSALRERGVSLETVRDIRWSRCCVKSIALLPNVLLKNTARRRGFFDAVIVGPDDTVREATAANVFIVKTGVLRTPPPSDLILLGVTRNHILDCARRLSIPCEEVNFTVRDLIAADEAFISSTSLEVMPVTSIDGQITGTGRPGPVTLRIHNHFWDPEMLTT